MPGIPSLVALAFHIRLGRHSKGICAGQRLGTAQVWVAIFLLMSSAACCAQDSMLVPPKATMGLVRLPTLFGDGACDPFQPKPVPLYAEPLDGARIGEVRVAKPWQFAAEGGCSGLEVKVYLQGASTPEPLPTMEYASEAPAAVVLARSGAWCQIQLLARTAWIHRECEPGFLSLEKLLGDKPLYLLHGALALARDKPAGVRAALRPDLLNARKVFATWMEVQTLRGQVWLHVRASPINACETEPAPQETQQFWLPLQNTQGMLTVWFHARGC